MKIVKNLQRVNEKPRHPNEKKGDCIQKPIEPDDYLNGKNTQNTLIFIE